LESSFIKTNRRVQNEKIFVLDAMLEKLLGMRLLSQTGTAIKELL
jgi:hypothetical protein